MVSPSRIVVYPPKSNRTGWRGLPLIAASVVFLGGCWNSGTEPKPADAPYMASGGVPAKQDGVASNKALQRLANAAPSLEETSTSTESSTSAAASDPPRADLRSKQKHRRRLRAKRTPRRWPSHHVCLREREPIEPSAGPSCLPIYHPHNSFSFWVLPIAICKTSGSDCHRFKVGVKS